MAAEIQLLACGYSAQCTVRGCRARATMLARYTDGQGRPLRQRELCERHAAWLKANRPNVHDLRGDPMPEKTVKRRLQDCDAALASDDGPILSTVAKLVEALKRSIPEGTRNAELKNEALRLARELLRGTKYAEE